MVNANCLGASDNERLSNFCLLNAMAGKIVDLPTAAYVENRFVDEGYTLRLTPNRNSEPKTSRHSFWARPTIGWSTNINGGNPDEPLTLGTLTFEGDEELVRKDGVLVGVNAGFGGRYIYGEGRYLNYKLSAGYAHSPEHGIGVARTGASICSKNHIKNWWYVDICGNTNRVRKDITDETNSNFNLTVSKIFSSAPQTHNQFSMGANRYFAEGYEQNQVTLGFDTIHSNGVFTGLNFTLGKGVENKLATRRSITARVGVLLASKPLSLSVTYSEAEGGVLLGIERNETTRSISVSYPIWRSLSASVGYRVTDSTIKYFDEVEPTLGIQFAPIHF